MSGGKCKNVSLHVFLFSSSVCYLSQKSRQGLYWFMCCATAMSNLMEWMHMQLSDLFIDFKVDSCLCCTSSQSSQLEKVARSCLVTGRSVSPRAEQITQLNMVPDFRCWQSIRDYQAAYRNFGAPSWDPHLGHRDKWELVYFHFGLRKFAIVMQRHSHGIESKVILLSFKITAKITSFGDWASIFLFLFEKPVCAQASRGMSTIMSL